MSHEEDRLKGNIKSDAGRAGRLALELRRNLHRRKQRARAVAARKHDDAGEAPATHSEESSQ